MLLLNSLRGMIRHVTARRKASRQRPSRSRLNRRLVIEELESRQLLSTAPPNLVFILTDDQDTETLQYMPRLQSLLADQGTTFTNMFVTTSQCCPSNVSILTGQYSHNHGILNNTPPLGGFAKFRDLGGEQSTVATWLHDAGYLTGRVGKYLVGYPTASTYVPPGWDEWRSTYEGSTSYFNYSLNENGNVVRYGDGPNDYLTDVLAERAVGFLDRAEANDDQPFFLFFSPTAPHADTVPNGPATPAPRHRGLFAGVQAPRTPSFNEADVSDKPPPIAQLPLLTPTRIAALDHEYQTRLEALQAADEAVERIVTALAERGELENTYIVFASDNGYFLGQHRLANGKFQIYEEAIRVPLIVRGPGVPQGVTRDHMVLNIDFAPTLAELSGAQPSGIMDGRSLVPLLQSSPLPLEQWRQDFLAEIYRPPPPAGNGDEIRALRTRNEVYVEYASGPRELYDLRNDPYQLQSLHAVADPARLQALSDRLHELATCSGDDCRMNPPAAQVASVVVNDGSAQRSMVTSLTLTFTSAMTVAEDAFELHLRGGDLVGVNVATSVVDGRTVAVLTFSGAEIVGGSLADGNYTLLIHGDRIHDLLGQELDGDGDGFVGGDGVEAFFRYYGDSDGDRDVDDFDQALFESTFGLSAADPGFLRYFDFDGDGDVDERDRDEFFLRFGTSLDP